MADNNSVRFQQFCNQKCAKVVFNFPPSAEKIPQGYLFNDQFHNKIEELGKQLLGFKSLIKYQLQIWQANQDGKQNNQQIHKWVCQFCYSYILYKFDVSKQKYISFQYQLTHFHSPNHFWPYLIEDYNRFQLPFFNQWHQLQKNREANMQLKRKNQHNRKQKTQINKLKPNINQGDGRQVYRKQEGGAILIQRMFRKDKVIVLQKQDSRQIAWILETRKLIDYIQPHRFQFPSKQSIPRKLNKDWDEAKIQQVFSLICESQKQMESEIWRVKIKTIGSHINNKQQQIRILCYCLSSLEQKCTFSLLYTQTNSDQVYSLQESQSIFTHHHIEQHVRQGQTKMVETWLAYRNYEEQRWNPYYRKQKNDVQYLKNVFPRVLVQRFQKQISLLLILQKESVIKLLQMKFIFHTQNRDIGNYEQIENQKLLLLQQKKMEYDTLIIIHPFMHKLFKIYNRVLIIESKKLQQPFAIHKMYSIYCFKGISYMGSQIYYAIGLVRDSKEEKIQIMLRIFMDKHQVIPNLILISESDPLLYSTTMAFFQNNYPEIVLQTRQTVGSDYHRVLAKERKTNDFSFMHFNIVQFQQKCIQEIPKQGLSQFSIFTLFYHHNLVKRNSCLLQNGYFVGCEMNSAAHCLNQFEKSKPKKLQTNIFHAQSTFLSLAIRALKVNKQQKQKFLYPMQVQKAIRIHQVQSIRILMSRRPFNIFMLRVMKIPQLTVTVREVSQFYIVQSNYTSNIVTWNPSKKNPVLLCDCKIRQKTGMPCEHIIKIALIEDINLIECIDKFWLVDSYAARHHSVDNSVEQMQKSKAGPIYVVKQNRKRPYSKLFHRQLVKRKVDLSKSKEIRGQLENQKIDRN